MRGTMELIIHTRHAVLADDFSQIVQEKVRSLERFSVLIERIEIEVMHEANARQGKHAHHVVITTHGAGPLMRAEARSFNDLAAFDEAVESIELQIRKIHEKSKSKKRDSLRFKQPT